MKELDKYVVGGISEDGKFEYLGHDYHSGGYPYPASLNSATIYKDEDEAVKHISEAEGTFGRLRDVKVYQIFLKEVEVRSPAEYEVDEILKNISPEALAILSERLP